MFSLLRKVTVAAAIALAFTSVKPAAAAGPDTADALFQLARSKAAASHKNVLLVFSASWCGPCKLYERFLEDPQMKAITEKAFVVERIDVGEKANDTKHTNTPGGEKLRSALGATPQPGFPFLVITDPNGKPLVNSFLNGDQENNVGYPVLPSEIDWYIAMLKQTAPSLSPQDLSATRTWLQAQAAHIR